MHIVINIEVLHFEIIILPMMIRYKKYKNIMISFIYIYIYIIYIYIYIYIYNNKQIYLEGYHSIDYGKVSNHRHLLTFSNNLFNIFI